MPETPVPRAPAAAAPEAGFRTILSAPVIGPVESVWAKVPVNARIAGAIGVVLILSAAFYSLGGSGSPPAATIQPGPALPVGLAGWVTNYSVLPAGRGMRRLSLVRASLNLTDFRMEFQGLIEAKALAWVFRVRDQRNFYVEKLEIVRTSPSPAVAPVIALTRFAVMDGAEQPRTQIQLPMQTYPDTLYRVRLDAVGSHFTTWIQDQRVDDWTDARIAAGAVGLDSEDGEIGALKGNMTVYPLVRKP